MAKIRIVPAKTYKGVRRWHAKVSGTVVATIYESRNQNGGQSCYRMDCMPGTYGTLHSCREALEREWKE